MLIVVYLVELLFVNVLGKAQPPPDQAPLILTPYLERGEIEQAKNLSVVDPTQFAGVNSHSGYFTVNKTNKWHLFFWYFPAEGVNLETTPLIIWLQGGPGCSSLFGLFEEIGPIQIIDGKVTRRSITWGSNYSLLFIDNPVGTGFSFSEEPGLYVTNEDMVGACLLSFIQQFLQVFSEVNAAPLFIAGESYAGKYIPAFGHYIHNNKNESALKINLKGLAIGDGWIDPPTMQHHSEWGLQLGLLDPEQADTILQIEDEARKYWDQHNLPAFAAKAQDAFRLLLKYAPVNVYNYLLDSSLQSAGYENFLGQPEIQTLIHAKHLRFRQCDFNVGNYLSDDMYDTVKPWLEELLENYGVMCYNGQLDVIVAYALSVHTYRSLKWSGREAYLNATRILIYDKNNEAKLNSFVKASGNFMDVMVRNAGHMVPRDQPRAAKQIIDTFIQKFK